jgi:hypothetical protein
MNHKRRAWLMDVIERRPARGRYEFCATDAEVTEVATDLEAAGFIVERKTLAGRHIIDFERIEL